MRGACSARVRDQQRQRPVHRAALRGGVGGEVLVGVDRDDPLERQRPGDVDVDHLGVRVRAAHEGDRERVLAEVVEVAALAAQQPGVLDAGDGSAHLPRRHARSRVISAARTTALRMFW